MNHPIKVITIVLAVPADSEVYMDLLSDLRDDSNGELIEWAEVEPIRPKDCIIDAESQEARDLFDSTRVSPLTHRDNEPQGAPVLDAASEQDGSADRAAGQV